MAAATAPRDGQRQPSEYINYTGASVAAIYKGTMIMSDASAGILPAARGTTLAHFLGVADNTVYPGSASGVSNDYIKTWKTGEFTFAAQGTGATTDIGKRAYIIDDQTVGISVGQPTLVAGEIVAVPTTSTYRVRIDNAVNLSILDNLLGGSITLITQTQN